MKINLFLSLIGKEKKNRNSFRFLQVFYPALSSHVGGQQFHSQNFCSYCLSVPNGNCLLPPGKKAGASTNNGYRGCQIYLGSMITGKDRSRTHLKGKQKMCAKALRCTSVPCSKKCLLAQG